LVSVEAAKAAVDAPTLAVLFANLIVAEQAERLGVRITFRDHLRLGLPVTLVSLVFAVAAMAFW
jgi:Na+/H+ antiporter NhaD/arsenite permease-like protein